MKTEFLVQLDGAGTKAKDVILVVGAYRHATTISCGQFVVVLTGQLC